MKNPILRFILDILFPFGSFLRDIQARNKLHSVIDLILHVLPLTFFIYWLFSLIPYGGLVYLLGFTIFAAYIHISDKNITDKAEKVSIILWYLVVVGGGFGGLRNFVGHFFLSDSVATSIGWATGSPFQIELAFYHLGVAIASLLAIWYRKNLVEGLAIIRIVFLLGAFFVHLNDIVVKGNYSESNTGVVLVGDLLFPIVLITLLILQYRTNRNR